MSKEIYISSTPHETRLAIVENDELTEIYYERENEYTLAGSIYNGRVTRVLPGMQSSFVDIGLERDAFLYITDFMEEAADTADFDHGEKPQRAPRLEAPQNGRAERGDSERNGERQDGYVSERNQEQARATPQSDVAQASEGRGEEFGGRGERNERGGRGRGRGRRDRGGNQADRSGQDRTGQDRVGQDRVGQDRPSLPPPASPLEAGSRFGTSFRPEPAADEEMMETVPGFGLEPQASTPVQEIGEAAPGADGSRRWRGRRGRRRGRGTGTRESAPLTSDGLTDGSIDGPTANLDPSAVMGSDDSGRDEFDEQPVFEIDGSAAEPQVAETWPTPKDLAQPAPPRHTEVAGRRDQPASEGRDGRGGRGDRSQRSGRTGGGERNAPRVPRGFAPRLALYGVDVEAETAETPDLAAPIEPLILPGESLGKYRKGADEASSAAQPVATPLSASETEFKIDPGWDGGAMLPGETLSRYRGGSPGSSGSSGSSASSAASQTRRPERSDLRGPERKDRFATQRDATQNDQSILPPAAMMVPSVVPPADRQSAGPAAGYASHDQTTEEIQAHRPDFNHAALPQATDEAPATHEAVPAPIERIDAVEMAEAHHPAVPESEEYEPSKASASYRVDPTPPREYRQSAPPAQTELDPHEVEPLGATEDASSATGFGQPLDSVHAGSAAVYEAHTEAVLHPREVEVEPAHAHEVTALNDMGTMWSASEATPAAAPLELERVHPDLQPDDMAEAVEDRDETGSAAHQGFAPGAGDLEEDFLDEEELDAPTLHAHGTEEFDQLEEEPLEGAADLGTMIRDMTLDQITRSESGVEEEEDFEEDTLEEDPDDAPAGLEPDETMHDEEAHEAYGLASATHGDETEDESEESDHKRGMQTLGEGSGSARDTDQADSPARDAERRGRRDGRRSGRDRDRGRSSSERPDRSPSNGNNDSNGATASPERGGYDRGGLGERARNTGGGGDRERSRSGGRGRQSMQMTNLPSISELLKPGQEILCQIAKEPIAKKGARITSHIALPGRFLVFMPTVMHTGVSRKIESDAERRRLKEILLSEKGDAAGGFIVRTAAGGASEDELRSDLRFLLNLWADIKARSESSKSPALIYHDLNLVERILRDQVTDNFSAIWVDTETEYERVLRFLQRFQPALIRRVKLYSKETPLFDQFGINEEINKALRSKVWLKSGGSIVINQTEALVAIDINTGKYVGKTARLEDTIVKTNLDAIPEIVRQIRLRDLGGIIIIDFIDMDERKNRNRVMAALEEELKNDRAPSKVLPFNDFGLVAITRKRVKQSLERTLSTPCTVCVGTGMVKSPVTVCNDIYIEMRKMHKHLDRGDVMLRVHPEVVKQLKATGTRWLQEMEEMCGKTILIKSDPALHPEQFDIH